MELLLSPNSMTPQISDLVLAAFRTVYGFLILALLMLTLPQWRRFFVSEKWNGYTKSSAFEDLTQNPLVSSCIAVIWMASSLCLITGKFALAAAFINLIFCRYFFVQLRWKSTLRGMGAPGFMSYWMATFVFLFQCAIELAPSLKQLVLLVCQIDFAFIMFSAGIYKFTAGYAQNEGMEYGLVNPEWGYWTNFYAKINTQSVIFKTMNHLAWGTEVVAAFLMIFPTTRFIGGALMLLSFIFIRTQIRLGVLCEMVITCCFIFFHPGSVGEQLLKLLQPLWIQTTTNSALTQNPALTTAFQLLLVCYLIGLPLAHAGLFYNFYAKKRLPNVLQLLLEKYTNFFGLIIWRVFSIDVVNFYILIYSRDKTTQERSLISKYGWNNSLRYGHVGESIAVTSLFTTLKYYTSNVALFNERILRYAKTLNCPSNCEIDFDYIRVIKVDGKFLFKKIATYTVDPVTETVEEMILEDAQAMKSASVYSPVHEGSTPGSYVPAGK